MNMGQVFKRATNRNPDATGVVDPDAGVRYTYREWYDRSTTVAASLREAGVGAGDFVATATRNRAELAAIYCATQLVGAVFVPLNYRSSGAELRSLVDDTRPEVLFFSAASADSVAEERDAFAPDVELVSLDGTHSFAAPFDEFLVDGGDVEPAFVDPDEPSVVLHTGGTTGDPKSVPRSHVNTYAAATAHAIQASWSRGETTLGLMSLSHTMGLHALAAVLVLGGTWVAQRRFAAEQTADLVESEGVTSLYLVPTVFYDLAEADALDDADLSSVRSLAFAGASMSAGAVREIGSLFDPDVFVNHYGSTEVYTHTVCEDVREKPGCAGSAGINTEIRIVEPSEFGDLDTTATVDRGDLGEVIVDASSPEAFDGYLGDASAGATHTLADGWFFTGDLGYRDEDGDLFIIGRVDDMIISGGENIYPVEVENVLETHDTVAEAAVVGRPSERWNQTVAAFVTLTEPPENLDFDAVTDELDEFCRASDDLADFKRPRTYFFIDELEKSNVGKILRKELQKEELDIHVYASVDVSSNAY